MYSEGVTGDYRIMGRMPTVISPLAVKVRENREKFTDEVTRQLNMPYEDVQKIASNFRETSLVLLIARTLVKCVTQADVQRIAFLLNNACGPLPKIVHVSQPGDEQGRPAQPLMSISSEQLFQALGSITKRISGEVDQCKTVESSSSQSSAPSSVPEQPTESCEPKS